MPKKKVHVRHVAIIVSSPKQQKNLQRFFFVFHCGLTGNIPPDWDSHCRLTLGKCGMSLSWWKRGREVKKGKKKERGQDYIWTAGGNRAGDVTLWGRRCTDVRCCSRFRQEKEAHEWKWMMVSNAATGGSCRSHSSQTSGTAKHQLRCKDHNMTSGGLITSHRKLNITHFKLFWEE